MESVHGFPVRATHLLFAWAIATTPTVGCIHRPETRWDSSAHRVCFRDTCFRVGALGPAWRVVHREEGAVGFFNQALGGVIEAKVTCRDDADAAPLSALANQLLVGYTDRRVTTAERLSLADREALHSVIEAKLDGVPVMLDVYIVKRNGCIFDLSYAAPPDRYSAGRPDFGSFVAGFADERRLS